MSDIYFIDCIFIEFMVSLRYKCNSSSYDFIFEFYIAKLNNLIVY